MIFVQVDESFGYDMLSVCEIKLNISRNMKNISNYERYFKIIEDQVGRIKHDTIIESEEYKELLKVNKQLFDGFNDIKSEKGKDILAITLDILNYNRHICKINLQNRFFPDKTITEVKLGYDKKDV